MYKVENELKMAIGAVVKYNANWGASHRTVSNEDKNSFSVAYRGNKVFYYDKGTKDFWVNDCGWITRSTVNTVNRCFEALDLPYKVFINKYRFCIRDLNTKLEKIIGDGVCSSDFIKSSEMWVKHVR